jgi:hypothetical protein
VSSIIEHTDSGNEQTVRIRDSEAPVPIKTYQAIYNQVTGRTEQLRKRFSEHLLIEVSEIEQLNHKILQLRNVHQTVAQNTIVSIFHEQDRKEQFTSFERFLAYNAGAASPTVNVVIKYNFSIIPAGINRPQEYVITVRLTSRVAIIRELEDENRHFGSYFLHLAGASPAEVTIDYVDYVIARGFLEAFEEWVKGCNASPNILWLETLQRRSHFIPKAMQILTAGLITWFAWAATPSFFSDNFVNETWTRFFVIYTGCAYILVSLAGSVGRLLERSIDNYPILSYLKLNKGDEKAIREFGLNRKKTLVKFLLSTLGMIVIGVISSKLSMLV